MRVRPKDDVNAPTDQDGIELHGSCCPSGGTVEFFLEPTRQQMRLLILGTSPVAAALIRLAQAMGYETMATAADAAARRQDEPSSRPEGGFDLADLGLRERDAIVVATQGRQDRQALEAALRSPAGYVGMVGSRAKIKTLLDRLDRDITDARKQSLCGPAGLDLGAIEPEKIALSILGEIIEARRKRR